MEILDYGLRHCLIEEPKNGAGKSLVRSDNEKRERESALMTRSLSA